MLEPWLLLQSILAGVAVAAPVGPMSLLCMQRTLHAGTAPGLAFGAGIAAADGTYAAFGAFGLSAVSSPRLAGDPVAADRGCAGAGVVRAAHSAGTAGGAGTANRRALALAQFRRRLRADARQSSDDSILRRPVRLARAAFAAVPSGVFAGSLLWWLALTGVIAGTAAKLSPPMLRWINRLSALALLGFALYALSGVAQRAPL